MHGAPPELPITRQLAAILKRRRAEIATLPGGLRDWVFPSCASASGHVVDLVHFYGLIGETGGMGFPARRLHMRLKVQRTLPTMWASWARHV